MNNIPSSSQPPVPSIHIQHADDGSVLFDGGEMFSSDFCNFYNLVSPDATMYTCSRGLQSEYPPSNAIPSSSSDLDDIPELSHLNTTTSQEYLTGHSFSLPYSILQENGTTDRGLSPSSLGSSIPSPTSSFGSSLSPPSFYDSIALSDNESPISPSPATPDQQIFWPPQVFSHQSSESLALYPFTESFPDGCTLPPVPQTGPRRSRSASSLSRREPVASKAMLEANSRRRRHPAQFECPDCKQTFTALFSLKRHTQSHTGEKPFACGIPGCTQRFYNSSDCKRHEKSKKRHKEMQ